MDVQAVYRIAEHRLFHTNASTRVDFAVISVTGEQALGERRFGIDVYTGFPPLLLLS